MGLQSAWNGSGDGGAAYLELPRPNGPWGVVHETAGEVTL